MKSRLKVCPHPHCRSITTSNARNTLPFTACAQPVPGVRGTVDSDDKPGNSHRARKGPGDSSGQCGLKGSRLEPSL